jgi:hypothetical protein
MNREIEFQIGNVVKWHDNLYVVAEDTGKAVKLIPMNSSNSMSMPSRTWPSVKEGRAAIKLVAPTVYAWLIKGIKRQYGIKGPLNANGWSL